MKKGLIVLGAGGHAKVCIELLRQMGEVVQFCIAHAGDQSHCFDIPILSGDDHLRSLYQEGYRRVFIAIGSNECRARLSHQVMQMGYDCVSAISSSAVISSSAILGMGVAIMAGVVINAEAKIGNFSIINTGATVDHECDISDFVHLAPQCALAGNVVVGKQSFLGIGSQVIPKIVVGEKVVIGAGSVVIRDVRSKVMVAGVPAKMIRTFD